MPVDTYFVVTWDEDGASIDEMDVAELERQLADDSLNGGECLPRVPDDADTNYWPEGRALIIKGRIVVPKAVKVVERYEVD